MAHLCNIYMNFHNVLPSVPLLFRNSLWQQENYNHSGSLHDLNRFFSLQMTHEHYHSSVVITVLRCITGCSCLTGLAVVSVVTEVSGATSQGESWLRLGTDPLEFSLVVCLLAIVAVPALGDSCNMWQHSSLKYQPTDADTFSATHYYAIHCAAAAVRTVAWGKMQCCPIWAIHSRFTLHFPANGNVFHKKLQSSLHPSQFGVKTKWKSGWEMC